MNDLQLIKKERFNNVECNFWQDEINEIWMTREQIGDALEYMNPREAIKNIHSRNRERLDKFSRQVQLDTPSGKQVMYLYNTKGVYEICRYSKQSKANDFYDWVYDLLEGIRLGNIGVTFKIPSSFSEALELAADLQKQLEEAQPKVQFYDEIIASDGLFNFSQIADTFGYGRNTLMKELRNLGILMNNENYWNIPYSKYIQSGYFTTKITLRKTDNGMRSVCTTLCKPKALKLIKELLDKKKNDLPVSRVI